jgi:trans-aconitate methyltransferase
MAQSHGHHHPETSAAGQRARHEHDWHSKDYVDEWVEKDRSRGKRRSPLLQRLIAGVPLDKNAPLRVLDVGGGYGAVSEQVLRAFPRAQVTLQDFSTAMLDEAREYLAGDAARMRYALGDLRERSWTAELGGPFDLAVSAIAIHNLNDLAQISAVYRDVLSVLAPGGWFVDYDHFDHVGDIEAHIKSLKRAGYAQVECLWYESPTGIIRARA